MLIIGGGVIGLFTARALLQAGLKAHIIERDDSAQQSSWAAAGVLGSVTPWEPARISTTLSGGAGEMYRNICAQLQRDTGLDSGFGEGGMLILPPWEKAVTDWLDRVDEDHRLLKAEGLQQLLGAAAPGEAEALLLTNRAIIRPPWLCRALMAWLRLQPGFVAHTGVCVESLIWQGRRLAGVRTDSGVFRAENYLIAAGAWSAGLVPEAGLDIAPVRGQMLAYKTGLELPAMSLVKGDIYAVLRPDGLVLVGSTMERVGFAPTPTPEGRALLMDGAGRLVPLLADRQPDYHWAGLRPGAARPLIGRLPQADNLWINAGHFRDGFSYAPRSADLLTALLLDRPPPIDPAPYRPH